MSRTYIPDAMEAGARLLTGCRARRLVIEGGRVTRVLAVRDGRTLEIHARAVVCCGGAVQTPALLRASGIGGRVGDTLRMHLMLKVAAFFDTPLDAHETALPYFQVKGFGPDSVLGGGYYSAGFLAVTLSDNWPAQRHFMADWRSAAVYYTQCRTAAFARVRAIPWSGAALVRYAVTREDRVHLTEGLARLSSVLFAAGATRLCAGVRGMAPMTKPLGAAEIGVLEAQRMSLSSVHAFSSCPMGEDSAAVTDSFGRVHGFDNLYACDGSILPGSPAVNPQATIMALAMRNAHHYLHWKDF